MAKTVIGLDIGSSAVRAVELSMARRGPASLDRVGQVALPAGAVSEGEIVDPDQVAAALRNLWSQFRFRGRRVAVGVANQQVVVRVVDLPYLPEDELRQSLPFQVQELIPFPVEQAVLDFHVTDHYETEDGARFTKLLLVAAQRSMVDGLLAALAKAKLRPVSLDLDAFAVLRSLAPQPALHNGDGELLIDVGHGVTNLLIHRGGVPRFVRILLMGGGNLTDGLAAALDISPEEAERAKLELAGGQINGEVARLASQSADLLADEIRGSLDFYAAQAGAVPVRRAVLSGGAGQLDGLSDRLAAILGMPVDRGHPLQEVRIGKVDLQPEQLVDAEPYLAVAVGLAQGVLA